MTTPVHTSSALALLIAAAVILASEPLYGENRPPALYTEVTGTKHESLTSSERSVPGGHLLASVSSDGDRHEVFVDEHLHTLWWTFRSPARGIDVRAVRRGDRIDVTGRLHGDIVEHTLTIDSAPWHQSIERSLEPFALGNAGSRTLFWVVEPFTLTPRKILARREGTADLPVEGRPVRAAEITISLPGFLSLFWHSSYWFRLSDGKFVRFEGLHGPPGSPLTVVQLQGESP